MRIWGRANSTNVKKVLWCADECGLRWEHVNVGGAYGGLDTPEFRSMNPLGLVPVLEDGGLVVTESNAIVRYLAATYAAGSLYPLDPRARAIADAWMDWTQTSLIPLLFTLIMGLVRSPPEGRDMVAITAARERALLLIGQLDRTLSRQPFLSGETLGIGDIPAGSAIHALLELGIGDHLPSVLRWYEMLRERSGYQKFVALPLT